MPLLHVFDCCVWGHWAFRTPDFSLQHCIPLELQTPLKVLKPLIRPYAWIMHFVILFSLGLQSPEFPITVSLPSQPPGLPAETSPALETWLPPAAGHRGPACGGVWGTKGPREPCLVALVSLGRFFVSEGKGLKLPPKARRSSWENSGQPKVIIHRHLWRVTRKHHISIHQITENTAANRIIPTSKQFKVRLWANQDIDIETCSAFDCF